METSSSTERSIQKMARGLASRAEKYRVTDKNFQRQIDNDKVFTCEKHFRESDIEISKSLCIFLSSFNRASLSTRLVKTCETFDEYHLNFYNTWQQLSYIFSTSCI